MASNAKKKTTMAKLQRENKVRERRLIKQARKEARKLGLEPAPSDAEETVEEDAWQLTRGLDRLDQA